MQESAKFLQHRRIMRSSSHGLLVTSSNHWFSAGIFIGQRCIVQLYCIVVNLCDVSFQLLRFFSWICVQQYSDINYGRNYEHSLMMAEKLQQTSQQPIVKIGHYTLGQTLGVGTFGKVKSKYKRAPCSLFVIVCCKHDTRQMCLYW